MHPWHQIWDVLTTIRVGSLSSHNRPIRVSICHTFPTMPKNGTKFFQPHLIATQVCPQSRMPAWCSLPTFLQSSVPLMWWFPCIMRTSSKPSCTHCGIHIPVCCHVRSIEIYVIFFFLPDFSHISHQVALHLPYLYVAQAWTPHWFPRHHARWPPPLLPLSPLCSTSCCALVMPPFLSTTAPVRFNQLQGLLSPALQWPISPSDIRTVQSVPWISGYAPYMLCRVPWFFLETRLAPVTPRCTTGWTPSGYNWCCPVGPYGPGHSLPLPHVHAYSTSCMCWPPTTAALVCPRQPSCCLRLVLNAYIHPFWGVQTPLAWLSGLWLKCWQVRFWSNPLLTLKCTSDQPVFVVSPTSPSPSV